MERLPIRLDFDQDGATVLALAREHRLTVYDAAYLELALRADLPLATLDRQLTAAARAARVSLLGGGDLREAAVSSTGRQPCGGARSGS
jgi:predicted nucleic acid-binding protein